MKYKLKRILSLLLCLVMVLGMLPTAAFAEESGATTGSGTASEPYCVSTYHELLRLLRSSNDNIYIKVVNMDGYPRYLEYGTDYGYGVNNGGTALYVYGKKHLEIPEGVRLKFIADPTADYEHRLNNFISVHENAELYITGEGSIQVEFNHLGTNHIINSRGKLEIDGNVLFNGQQDIGTKNWCSPINVESGQTIINGGRFYAYNGMGPGNNEGVSSAVWVERGSLVINGGEFRSFGDLSSRPGPHGARRVWPLFLNAGKDVTLRGGDFGEGMSVSGGIASVLADGYQILSLNTDKANRDYRLLSDAELVELEEIENEVIVVSKVGLHNLTMTANGTAISAVSGQTKTGTIAAGDSGRTFTVSVDSPDWLTSIVKRRHLEYRTNFLVMKDGTLLSSKTGYTIEEPIIETDPDDGTSKVKYNVTLTNAPAAGEVYTVAAVIQPVAWYSDSVTIGDPVIGTWALTAKESRTFISKVDFETKAVIDEAGELIFTAEDEAGNPVTVTVDEEIWTPETVIEGNNKVSFKLTAPEGYSFVKDDGTITTLTIGGTPIGGYVDSDGKLCHSFTQIVSHQHKYDTVKWNDRRHWDECSCGKKENGADHTMGEWSRTDTTWSRICTADGCGYTESYSDFSGTYIPVTDIVLSMEHYPMSGMKPHNFVQNGSDTMGADDYKLTDRDESIVYPTFSIVTGKDEAKITGYAPENYSEYLSKVDFARWFENGGAMLQPSSSNTTIEGEFRTGTKYQAKLILEAEEGYAFNSDFRNNGNVKLYTEMANIPIESYNVTQWYYNKGETDFETGEPIGESWYNVPPSDTSAGASKVQIQFTLTAMNEGDLNITLPELKAGEDLKNVWPGFDGTANFGTGNFVNSCYASEDKLIMWTDGPSKMVYNNNVTGESKIAQAGETYTLTIPAVKDNVLAHITIKNPEVASVTENSDGTITVTYTLPAASDKTLNGASVSVTAPVYGNVPDTTATVPGGAQYTASEVTWSPSAETFGYEAYKATVTLTPNEGYAFADGAGFTIDGKAIANTDITKETNGKVTLSYTFPSLSAPHEHDFTGQPWIYLDSNRHYQMCKNNDGLNIQSHSFSAWTDDSDGTTHSRTCDDCTKSGETKKYKETANHNWMVVVDKAATVTESGIQHEECTVCHAKRNENTVIPAHGHNLVRKDAKEATCTEAGYKGHYQCTDCGLIFADDLGVVRLEASDIVIPAAGHVWNSTYSYDADGHWTSCTVCGEVSEKTAHTFNGATCLICGYQKNTSSSSDSSHDSDSDGDSGNSESSGSSGSSYSSSTRSRKAATGIWIQDEKGWWYKFSNGTYPRNGWAKLPWQGIEYWYYFDADGYMKMGWLESSGSYYYLNPIIGTNSGKMLTGWQLIDQKWYYFSTEQGAKEGSLLRNTVTPDNYQVDQNGVWKQ